MDEYPAWELEMLLCDKDRSEKGTVLWFCKRLQQELRLCVHHSKLNAASLTRRGFVRLPMVGQPGYDPGA